MTWPDRRKIDASCHWCLNGLYLRMHFKMQSCTRKVKLIAFGVWGGGGEDQFLIYTRMDCFVSSAALLTFEADQAEGGGWGGEYIGITSSVCLSSCPCVWSCLHDISRTAQPFLTKWGVEVYYEVEWHAEKLVYYLPTSSSQRGLIQPKYDYF